MDNIKLNDLLFYTPKDKKEIDEIVKRFKREGFPLLGKAYKNRYQPDTITNE